MTAPSDPHDITERLTLQADVCPDDEPLLIDDLREAVQTIHSLRAERDEYRRLHDVAFADASKMEAERDSARAAHHAATRDLIRVAGERNRAEAENARLTEGEKGHVERCPDCSGRAAPPVKEDQ